LPRLAPAVVYHKDRPSVTGDGLHSLLELALAAMPAEQHSTVLPGMLADFGRAELDAVRLGQRRNPELAPRSRFRGDAGPAGAG
jgi:hypothetical protein